MHEEKIQEAIVLLKALGLPAAQQNQRSALSLFALLMMSPDTAWKDAGNPLIGITPIINWIAEYFGRRYAPNSRETIRRKTMHQFCDAGISLYNPDMPDRPVNSPNAVYRIEFATLELIRGFGSERWEAALSNYLEGRETLVAQYANEREQNLIPVKISDGVALALTPGEHSKLIRRIIEDFAPRFTPGAKLIYAGDTGAKLGFFDKVALSGLGVQVNSHGKMPDVILHFTEKTGLYSLNL